MRLSICAVALTLAVSLSNAQLMPLDPDWRESAAPPPPALKLDGLIAIELPGSSLRFGVDPASITLGSDGVVRYVVVARSTSGAVNGLYEGLKCSTGEVKVYGRHIPDSGWRATNDAPWRPLHEQASSRHSLAIARSGACIGHAPNGSPEQIVRDLRSPIDTRFRTETR